LAQIRLVVFEKNADRLTQSTPLIKTLKDMGVGSGGQGGGRGPPGFSYMVQDGF